MFWLKCMYGFPKHWAEQNNCWLIMSENMSWKLRALWIHEQVRCRSYREIWYRKYRWHSEARTRSRLALPWLFNGHHYAVEPCVPLRCLFVNLPAWRHPQSVPQSHPSWRHWQTPAWVWSARQSSTPLSRSAAAENTNLPHLISSHKPQLSAVADGVNFARLDCWSVHACIWQTSLAY